MATIEEVVKMWDNAHSDKPEMQTAILSLGNLEPDRKIMLFKHNFDIVFGRIANDDVDDSTGLYGQSAFYVAGLFFDECQATS